MERKNEMIEKEDPGKATGMVNQRIPLIKSDSELERFIENWSAHW